MSGFISEMLMGTIKCSLRMIYCGIHLIKNWYKLMRGGETENITEVTNRTQKAKTKTKRHISSLKFFTIIN